MKYFLLYLALGILTYFGISALDMFSASEKLSEIQDTLLMPGAIIPSLLWPEGVESDHGYYWLILTVSANVIIFASFWFFVISIAKVTSLKIMKNK